VSRNVFQTAQFLLTMAQEEAKKIAEAAEVPITVDCGLKQDDAGFVVTVNFRVPFAIADAASTDDAPQS
jgi:hypothetical protein